MIYSTIQLLFVCILTRQILLSETVVAKGQGVGKGNIKRGDKKYAIIPSRERTCMLMVNLF